MSGLQLILYHVVVLDIPVSDGGWLKVNRDQIGYYRVNYPRENWINLAKTLLNRHEVRKRVSRYRRSLLGQLGIQILVRSLVYSITHNHVHFET